MGRRKPHVPLHASDVPGGYSRAVGLTGRQGSLLGWSGSDRCAVADNVCGVGKCNGAESECVVEIVDTDRRDAKQKDYRVVVAENSGCAVKAYVCWGPTPLTRGT